MRGKNLWPIVVLFDLRSIIHYFRRECYHSNRALVTKTVKFERRNVKIHEQLNTSLSKINSAKNKDVKQTTTHFRATLIRRN